MPSELDEHFPTRGIGRSLNVCRYQSGPCTCPITAAVVDDDAERIASLNECGRADGLHWECRTNLLCAGTSWRMNLQPGLKIVGDARDAGAVNASFSGPKADYRKPDGESTSGRIAFDFMRASVADKTHCPRKKTGKRREPGAARGIADAERGRHLLSSLREWSSLAPRG